MYTGERGQLSIQGKRYVIYTGQTVTYTGWTVMYTGENEDNLIQGDKQYNYLLTKN